MGLISGNPFSRVPQLDPKTAMTEWQGGDVQLLDVREQPEWDLGHIDGARLIPLGQLSKRVGELDPAKRVICVCRSGSRSNYAALMLRGAGLDAANMSGGMLAWKIGGLPVTPPGIVEAH